MKALIVFILPFFSSVLLGQSTITGKITDSTGKVLPYSTVVISKLADSTMVGYAITDNSGNFIIEKVIADKYIFQASFMGYANYNSTIEVQKNQEKNLGTIVLKDETKELGEVVIEGEEIPILFKKDTVEYNAGSFKTKKNDNVEGLLKQLPGLEVDENGDVTAHGEKVTKVLVDGKEFFGDDPKIATKNIPADAIKKVQVFDKKSDLSDFTGIDDGERSRTINLTLKEDRKQGYFGDIYAGGGYQDRYEGKLNLNRFSKTAQFTSLVMANNVNKQGFSFQDYFNFMGGISNVLKNGKMNFDPQTSGIPINTPGLNNGVANTIAGGINYNQDFGKSTHIISSFFVNNSDNLTDRNSTTTTFTDEGDFTTTNQDLQDQYLQNYRLNVELEHEFNKNNIADFKVVGIYTDNKTDGFSGESATFQNGRNNQSTNDYDDFGIGLNGTIDVNYRKRFEKKTGRSLNFSGNYYLLQSDNLRFTDIERTFFIDTNQVITDLTQIQDQLEDNQQLAGTVTFTEPLNRTTFLITEYQSYYQRQKNNKNFFDLINGNEQINPLLSNDFVSEYNYHQLGAKVNYKYKKNLFVLGLDGQLSHLEGTTAANINAIDRNFSILLPNFYWKNQASMSKRFELKYTTSFNEPSVTQLQPVINNTNPLNTYTGNPNLVPEYDHNVSYSYFLYDAFNFSNLYFNVSASATENKIVNQLIIDSTTNLRSTSPINTASNLGGQLSGGYGFRIKKLKTRVRTRGSVGFNKGINFVNSIENDAYTYNYTGRLSFGNMNKKVVDFNTGASVNVNQNMFSINAEANTTYTTTTVFAELNVDLKNKWSFGFDANQNFYSGSQFQNNPSIFILNAYISKTILKNQRGDLKLYVNDVFNQRAGLNFFGQQNYFTESQVNVIPRYFMLSFNYKIIKI